ncbi:hypothetical protein [Rhizobacter sp. LjRoot28]|uniref:hypothetical protein n=1 Tax=Rhizobacter sp. LjRoot28 TaxID=3342309 RepID=UPI003ECC3C9A
MGFAKGVLLTVLTLGIFPGIYVVVLAFDLQRYSEARSTVGRQRYLGSMVLAGDALSLALAVASGGLALVLSVVLWTYCCYLLSRELALYGSAAA